MGIITQNGQIVTVNGSILTYEDSGGGGLEYETGTWTPAEDINNPTISFIGSHSNRPYSVVLADSTETPQAANNGLLAWAYTCWYDAFGVAVMDGETGVPRYGRVQYGYGGAAYGSGGSNLSAITGTGTTAIERYMTNTGFQLYSCTCKAGRTYKWIAVWTPTT